LHAYQKHIIKKEKITDKKRDQTLPKKEKEKKKKKRKKTKKKK